MKIIGMIYNDKNLVLIAQFIIIRFRGGVIIIVGV